MATVTSSDGEGWKSELFSNDGGKVAPTDTAWLPSWLARGSTLAIATDVMNKNDTRFEETWKLDNFKKSQLWEILRANDNKRRNSSRLSKNETISEIKRLVDNAREILLSPANNDWAKKRQYRSICKMVAAHEGVLTASGRQTMATETESEQTAIETTKVMFESDDLSEAVAAMEKHIEGRLGAAIEGTKAEARAVSELHTNEMLDAKNKVMRDMREYLKDVRIPQKITIQRKDIPDFEAGVQHYRFPELAALVGAGIPVLMVGPAGGGKTEAAATLAKGLDSEFVPLSLGPQTTQAQIFGYVDANGKTVRTPFREAYESGGVILLDELDRCNERVSVTLNAAVANGRCSFPDTAVNIHEDTRILAAGNTAGQGADRQYVSARQQDAALLDRFAVLQWPWDEGFETALVGGILEGAAGEEWLREVRTVRAKVEELHLRYVVSPRASIQGATCITAGCDKPLVRDTILYRGWDAEDRRKVERA